MPVYKDSFGLSVYVDGDPAKTVGSANDMLMAALNGMRLAKICAEKTMKFYSGRDEAFWAFRTALKEALFREFGFASGEILDLCCKNLEPAWLLPEFVEYLKTTPVEERFRI